MNPVGNVYCDKCNARLIPMAAPIKGLSLPTIPLEKERERQVEDVTEEVGVEEEAEDWLAQLRALAEEEAEEAEVTTASIEPVEIPDWLRDLGPIGVEAEAAADEERPAAETPLKEEAPTMPPPVPAEIPEWLQELAPPGVIPTEPVAPFPESALEEILPPPPTEIPAWLREIVPPEVTAEAAPPSPPPFVGIPPSAVPKAPEWLREIALEEEAAPEVAPSLPPLVEFPEEAETAEVPEWLGELKAEAVPALPAFEGLTLPLPPEPGAEGLARAEIPDWLEALRPRPEVVKEGPRESEGLLEGLRGMLPPAPAIEVPPIRESALPAAVSQVSLARAQLLQSLLARPAEIPRPEVRKRRISIGELIQRWLVAAVLLVAVGGTLMAPLMMLNVPTLAQPAISPQAIRLYNVVQGVGAEDTVLVAFEYGPPEADELNLVAEPILHHLLDQGAHISVVSTRPEGLTVAAGLLSTIAPEEQYTLAGYRPGGATGVSQLLTASTFPPVGGTEGGIPPVGRTEGGRPSRLILVLTAQPAPLRWWVEQTRALYGDDTLPVVAGVSAALEPAASPYLDSSAGQLEGAIHGLSGAAAYEALRGGGGQAAQRLHGLAAGHAAIVGLMVLGAALYVFGGRRRRGR